MFFTIKINWFCNVAVMLFLLPQLAFTQTSPVTFSSWATRIIDNQYLVKAKILLPKGWYLYTQADMNEGIDSPSISWNNENISVLGNSQITTVQSSINDPIFLRTYQVGYDSVIIEQLIQIEGFIPAAIKCSVTAYAANGKEFLPVSGLQKLSLQGGSRSSTADNLTLPGINLQAPLASCGSQIQTSSNAFITFLIGLLGGLIALLTPCVFPMIPVTVSFFTNKSSSKKKGLVNGILYGSFIFLIYTAASIPFHLAGNLNPEIFNSISTNAAVNVFFFLVFIFFALSFFGLFEITLPSSLSNKAGSREGLGSILGIFFMSLTLVIVSFSCTGPILGTLLVGSLSSAGAWQLTAGMAGFGLALGLPFTLFALFPNWLKSLPKSGGWMETVKKSLAFIELALAIKFLSNADLVQHWGILKREVFIGMWVLIALAFAAYLLNLLPKPKKNSHGHLRVVKNINRWSAISKPRLVSGFAVLLFAVYLLPGLTKMKAANLKLLSGFPPPLSYSIYGKQNIQGKGLEPDVINDYDKALELAREQNKPLLIDFTGWGCVNCRKMEEQVWTRPEIAEIIKEQFILVSLYVDDRKKLPASEQFTYTSKEGKEKDIITLGDKWATFQAENFRQVTQPLYVVLSPGGQLLNHPIGYTSDADKYASWLTCGIKGNKKLAMAIK